MLSFSSQVLLNLRSVVERDFHLRTSRMRLAREDVPFIEFLVGQREVTVHADGSFNEFGAA